MSFLKNIFSGSNEETNQNKVNNMAWVELTQMGQLERLIQESKEKPVLIFKHSTHCSISRMALKQFERDFDMQDIVIPYFLDLLTYRSISNEIASQFQVMHQSPQLLVIQDGVCVYDASHSDIDATLLQQFV